MFLFSLALFLIAVSTMPWWSVALVAFFVGLFRPRAWRCGAPLAAASALAWCMAAYVNDVANQMLVSQRLAELLQMPSSVWVYMVMAFSGAVTGWLAGALGYELSSRRAIAPRGSQMEQG